MKLHTERGDLDLYHLRRTDVAVAIHDYEGLFVWRGQPFYMKGY
ncbi:hypothetical protein [Fictibacillus sp. NRS-1165]